MQKRPRFLFLTNTLSESNKVTLFQFNQIKSTAITTTTTTALFSPQMLKIVIVYGRFTPLQNKEDHGHPKIAGASRVK